MQFLQKLKRLKSTCPNDILSLACRPTVQFAQNRPSLHWISFLAPFCVTRYLCSSIHLQLHRRKCCVLCIYFTLNFIHFWVRSFKNNPVSISVSWESKRFIPILKKNGRGNPNDKQRGTRWLQVPICAEYRNTQTCALKLLKHPPGLLRSSNN